jgi:hypothetical protein
MFWRPYNNVDKAEGRWKHGYIIGHAAGCHPRVLLLPEGGHEVIRHRNFKLLSPTEAQISMLAALAVKDGPDSYQDMLSDWKLELATTPDDFPHIRTAPLVHLRAPAYPPSADDDILPQSESHVMPTITDDIRPVSPPLADTVSAPILELPLTQEVPPTFESLTPTELIQPLTVELTGRPRCAAAANAQTPGFYRHLANVNTINTPRDPYDDIYGCNMHFA